jgi:hypothetical protein
MRKKERVGSRYVPELQGRLTANQHDLADELTTPHSYKITEYIANNHKIISRVPAQNPEAQPTQARGGIVWSRAFTYQPHAPSYLDPVPDPDALTRAR